MGIRIANSGNGRQVRRLYEMRPYPGVDESVLSDVKWRLAPMEWLTALWKPGQKEPAAKRILVAGCGTGSEAFAMRRKWPKAKIVAIDFSPRSIAIAQKLQKGAPEMRSIRFQVANLLNPDLAGDVGRDFDFISCHGVISYLPVPARALTHLARCLKPDGALYLGANGADHPSVGGRPFLAALGCEMAEYRESPRVRRLVKLIDTLLDRRGPRRISAQSDSYLASDLFGPLIHNLPLSGWVEAARQAGLHLHDNYSSWRLLRSAMEKEGPELLIPKSRPELCEMLDNLHPASFHRLLFTRQRPCHPPWEDRVALLEWRPVLTGLYTHRLPKRSHSWQVLRAVSFKSPCINTRLDWQMPEWELEILRRSDGGHSLGDVLQRIPLKISSPLLTQQLYMLHQLAVLSLQSPV